MLFHFFHVDEKSSFGREDLVQVETLLDTPQGRIFVPVAMMGDNPRSHEALKIWLKGIPAGDNVILR